MVARAVAEDWWAMPPAVHIATVPARSAAHTSLAERLQQIVLGWKGAERKLARGAIIWSRREENPRGERRGERGLRGTARQPLDGRVLEAYPQLADLLRSPDEPLVTAPTDPALVDRLGRAGWRGQR